MQTNTQDNTALVAVPFNGQYVVAAVHNGKPYVAMKPICENIGLQWEAQYKRIKRHPVMLQGMSMIDMPSNGGIQQTACLPLDMLNGWLFGIDASRVKPELREKVIRYQLECFKVLHDHFMRQDTGVPADLYARALKAEKDEAASKALASVAGRALSLRRKEKKVLGEIVALLREEVQLKLTLSNMAQ